MGYDMTKATISMQPRVRATERSDIPAIKIVLDAVDLFPSLMLDEMIAPFFSPSPNEERWLSALVDGAPAAVAYYVPERMTRGAWNLLLIAVDPTLHNQGIGRAVMRYIEDDLITAGGRVLLVETSGQPAFDNTRAFYHRIGYHEEARIRDFYDIGDDKIVFLKSLAGEMSTPSGANGDRIC